MYVMRMEKFGGTPEWTTLTKTRKYKDWQIYLLKDGIDNMATDLYTAEGLAYWSVIVT